MDGFNVYQKYVAVRAHFTSNYDFVKCRGKTRVSVKSYNNRNDKYYFEKFGRVYKDNEILPLFVSIFLQDSSIWVGDLNDTNHYYVYKEWVSRLKTLKRVLHTDINNIERYCAMHDFSIDDILCSTAGLPMLYKLYLTDKIKPETVILYEQYFNLSKESEIVDPVHKRTFKHLMKYKMFIQKVDWTEYYEYIN